jgi:anti-sigma28 factor (negative regulator of flagellin synthesis)
MMKIENNSSRSIGQPGLGGARNVDGPHGALGAERGNGPGGKDQLAISEDARLLMKARVELREHDEIRADKVAALRRTYEAGTYTVPFEMLARRIRDVLGIE